MVFTHYYSSIVVGRENFEFYRRADKTYEVDKKNAIILRGNLIMAVVPGINEKKNDVCHLNPYTNTREIVSRYELDSFPGTVFEFLNI